VGIYKWLTTPLKLTLELATRDGKAQVNGTMSDDMKALNRAFSKAHAMSIHLNLVTIGATLWYGWRLASKLQFKV
jgi:hypothetical protein